MEVPEYCAPEPQLEAKSDLLEMLWPRGSGSVAGQTNNGEIVEQRSAEIFYARPLDSPLLESERKVGTEVLTVSLYGGAGINPPHIGGEKTDQTPQSAREKKPEAALAEEFGKSQIPGEVEAKEQETGRPVRCEAASEKSGLPLEQDLVNGNNLLGSNPLSSPVSIPLTSEETFTLRPPRKMGSSKTSGMRTPGLRSSPSTSEPGHWVQFPHHPGARGDSSHDRYPNLSRPRFSRRGNPDSGGGRPLPVAIPRKADDLAPNIPGYLGNPMFNTRAMGRYHAQAVAGTPTKPRRKEDDSGMSQEWAAAAAAHGPKNFDLWIDAVKTRKDIRQEDAI